MNLAQLREEFYSRGFRSVDEDTGSNVRADYFLNRGYHMLCEREPWPFLRATTSGTAPLTISDLRQILYVTDTTNSTALEGADERSVRDWDPGLEDTGTASQWFLTGSTTLNVWPADTTSTISVVYLEVPDDLSDSNTTPVVPSRYHYLIVEAACHHAYRDNEDFDEAQMSKAVFDSETQEMSDALLARNYMNPESIVVLGGFYDG